MRAGPGITGTWGADGQILFASIDGRGIFRVSVAGGEPVLERERQPEAGIQRVVWPSFLPDGRRYLYLIRRPDRTYHIMLGEPGAASREVRASDSFAQYVAPGYLVFARDGTLLAQRFDAAAGRVTGEPSAIAQPVASFATVGWAAFAVSPHGVLAFASPGNRARLHWFDRAGGDEALESTASMLWVRFSPDGRRALFNREDPRTGNLDIWSLDLARGVESRVTADPDTEIAGLLLPDGTLVYSDPRGASPQIFRRDLGTGETRELTPEGSFQMAQDLSPDGRTLVFAERVDYGAWDLFTIGPARVTRAHARSPTRGLGAVAPASALAAAVASARAPGRRKRPANDVAPDGRFLATVPGPGGFAAPMLASEEGLPTTGRGTGVGSGGEPWHGYTRTTRRRSGGRRSCASTT